MDAGGPVFGQSYAPVLGAIERVDGDFRVTGMGFGLRASVSGMAWVELAVVFISV